MASLAHRRLLVHHNLTWVRYRWRRHWPSPRRGLWDIDPIPDKLTDAHLKRKERTQRTTPAPQRTRNA
jgi:hypothetical protein